MTTIDKKILQKGWTSKQSSFPRQTLNNQMSDKDRPFPSKKFYKCKKLKGDHKYKLVLPTASPEKRYVTYPSSKAEEMANLFQPRPNREGILGVGAKVFVCEGCGKINTEWYN